ncbi:MAG: 3-oxoacyl-ACP reductase [Proteobacteria bacterium]|nr:3-oxoacyl-ACP reductase [Pseudomonadota bacterium]
MKKLVLISGSGRGLGAGIAQSFVDKGYDVALNYFKSKEKAEELAQQLGGNTVAFQADVSDKEQVIQMIADIKEHYQKSPEIVINNAMTDYVFNGEERKKADEIEWNDIQNHLNVTVQGSLNLIQASLPGMKEQGFGRIVNIGTNLFQNPVVPYHDYTIAKGALLAMTRTFAKDLGANNITVNMVSGGLLKVTDASAATPDEVFDFIASVTPLQKVTTVSDFSDAVLFFASSNSRAVTGQNLVVDGGLTFN